MYTFHQSNLNKDALPWGKDVETGIKRALDSIDSLRNDYGNGNKAQGSTMKLLSNQIVNLQQTLQDALDNVTLSAGQITAGTFGAGVVLPTSGLSGTVGNTVNTAGNVTAANVTGGNVFAQSLATDIPQTRVSLWGRVSDGFIGTASSSRKKKTNIVDSEIDAEKVLSIGVKHYNYKTEVAKRDDPNYPGYIGPEHNVHLEVGAIAEDLHDAGLWEFVVYQRDENDNLVLDENGDPQPEGIHYELFALAVLVAAQSLNTRLTQLEADVSLLKEGK